MAYKLFSLSEDGDIIINKLIILTIPSFKSLLQRDKGSTGDVDGRKKLMAFKELAYIYHIADRTSVPSKQGHNDKEAHKYAVLKSGLHYEYTPDTLVKECIKNYKDEQSNVAYDTINELVQTFRLTHKLVKQVKLSLERQIDTGEVNVDVATDILNKIGFLIESSKKIPNIVKDLNNAIKELEIEGNDMDAETIRGTKERVPDSADPTKDY